ncbi:MAG: penicillin acylase family protein [Bacteroidota bacterium]
MTRVLLSLGLALAGFLVLAGAVAVLAYGAEPTREGTLRVPGLESEAVLSWTEAGHITIEADEETALWTGLGYAHGADHGWSMALWRQAALGTLSLWTGPEALDLDRHASRLGFAALARETYAALLPEDRSVVDAYARGVRLAFEDEAVAERDEFIELDVTAEAWEPWHALAIERLVAWLGTDPLPTAGDDPEAAFARQDSLFRATLALGGLSNGRAYVAPSRGDESFSAGPTLVYHQPYGASALPLLVGARVAFGSREQIVATIPGTLILPASTGAWAVLLTSDATFVRSNEPSPPPVYSRLIDRGGVETLLTVLRDSSGLVLTPLTESRADTSAMAREAREPLVAPTQAGDLGVRVRWNGFRPGSDVGAFRALLRGRVEPFSLLRGDGLRLSEQEAIQLGEPALAMVGREWVYVSGQRSGAAAARRLESLAEDPNAPDGLALDLGSPWALRQTRDLVQRLGNRDSLALDLQDAYAFLRGWDGLYTPDAIAPSIAEVWTEAHREVFGRSPLAAQRADSLLVSHTLRLGLARLRDSLGSSPSQWSWAQLSGPLQHPLIGDNRRLGPQTTFSGGHPTSPRPGLSLTMSATTGGAIFSFWTDGASARTLHPALPVARGRDSRTPRQWPPPDTSTSLRLIPA